MNTTIEIEWRILKAMRLFVSTDSSRYILGGVNIKLNGDVRFCATDGRRLAVYRVQSIVETAPAEKGELTLPVDWLAFFKWDRKFPAVKLTIDGMNFTATYRDRSVNGKLIDGTYPRYEHIIPADGFAPLDCFALNAEYIQSFSEASSILLGKRDTGIRIYSHGLAPNGNAAALSVFTNDSDFYGALMPMRSDGFTVPAWLKAAPKTETKPVEAAA